MLNRSSLAFILCSAMRLSLAAAVWCAEGLIAPMIEQKIAAPIARMAASIQVS